MDRYTSGTPTGALYAVYLAKGSLGPAEIEGVSQSALMHASAISCVLNLNKPVRSPRRYEFS